MHERLAKDVTREVIRAGEINFGNPEDPVVEFIHRLEDTEAHLQVPLEWAVSHGRRRKRSNMRNAREDRESQLRSTHDALIALKDPNFVEATFFKNEYGKIIGFKIDSDKRD